MKYLLSLAIILSFNTNAFAITACGKELQGLKGKAEQAVNGILKENPVCKDAFYKGSQAKDSVKACPSQVWKQIEKTLKAKAKLLDETCMSDACIDSENCLDVIDMDAIVKKGFNGGVNLDKVKYNVKPKPASLQDIPAISI